MYYSAPLSRKVPLIQSRQLLELKVSEHKTNNCSYGTCFVTQEMTISSDESTNFVFKADNAQEAIQFVEG